MLRLGRMPKGRGEVAQITGRCGCEAAALAVDGVAHLLATGG
jgi:hypothetical protein